MNARPRTRARATTSWWSAPASAASAPPTSSARRRPGRPGPHPRQPRRLRRPRASATSSARADARTSAYGGTLAIDSPAPYSARGQGPDLRARHRRGRAGRRSSTASSPTRASSGATFFDKETFGQDKLVKGLGRRRRRDAERPRSRRRLAETPLRPEVRRDILRLETEELRLLARSRLAEKKARLAAHELHRLPDQGLEARPGRAALLPDPRPRALRRRASTPSRPWTAGGSAFPGFQGLKLEPG